MRRPGTLVHHAPSDFGEDSDLFKDFGDLKDWDMPSGNMRHYDLGDGVRVGIGRHNDDESLNSEESNESNESSELDMSSHSTPMGQQLRSLGQGFFMNKGTDIKREQFNLKTPFIQLINGLHSNEHIRLVGKQTSSRWSINLCHRRDRMLNVSSRFDQRCIVRNNSKHGRWMDEERDGGQPIQKSKTFTMDLICNRNGDTIMIYIDGRKFCDFQIREPLEEADRLEISSGIEIHMLGLYDEDD